MRFLGIDYGEKRIGLAYGDELGLAYPLPAAVEAEKPARMAHIAGVIAERRVETLVVGYPYHMDGTVSAKAREVDSFIAELEARFALPVVRTDERLTSVQAESGPRKKKFKSVRALQQQRKTGETDSRAASIFLQDYLDQMILPLPPPIPED